MIPLWMSLHVRSLTSNIRLGIPLFLLWLLLLPLVLLAAPFALLACLIFRVNPLPRLSAIWGVLTASPGTHVEVAAPRARVFLHLY